MNQITNSKYIGIKMLKENILASIIFATSIIISTSCFAGWQDALKQADDLLKGSTGTTDAVSVGSSLSNDKVSQGLKEALDVGVANAITMLGKDGGFLNDQAVKIMLPDEMKTVDKLLRAAGQDKVMDDFVTSMNRAAEQAVPQVSDIFVDEISKMSLSDAQGILAGSDTAATDYFRKNTSAELTQLIKPHVNTAMEKTQVTNYYKSLTSMVKQYDSFGLMKSYMGDTAEIDDYVTNKTMEGLFNKIAVQEKLIRDNPMARSSDLLKEVFSSSGQ